MDNDKPKRLCTPPRCLWPAGWLLLLLLIAASRPAAAQHYGQYATDTTQVFNYVDQMPALPDGGGNLALVKAVQQQLQLPAEVREGRIEGRVFVRVVMGVSGVGRQAAVVQSLSPACDAAALAAVKRCRACCPAATRASRWRCCSPCRSCFCRRATCCGHRSGPAGPVSRRRRRPGAVPANRTKPRPPK